MVVLCHTFAIIWRYNDYVEKAEDKDIKMLKSICEAMGNRILAFCAASGKLTLLLLATLRRLKDANAKEVVRQMALLGADSLPIVMMTILCTGMVFSVQTAKEFVRLGASSSVGGIVAIAMARELVPVLTGVVVAGRIGAAIAAELGTMKVTEQIDALRVMAANPVSYLVVPRFIALVLMMPVLVVLPTLSVISAAGLWRIITPASAALLMKILSGHWQSSMTYLAAWSKAVSLVR